MNVLLIVLTTQRDGFDKVITLCLDGICFWRDSPQWARASSFARFLYHTQRCRLRLKCDGTRAETRFCLSAKRTSPFKSAGASVQSTAGSRGVRISGSNAGYTKFRGSERVLATHSIRQFPLHFPSRASPCAITFQLDSTTVGRTPLDE